MSALQSRSSSDSRVGERAWVAHLLMIHACFFSNVRGEELVGEALGSSLLVPGWELMVATEEE